MIKLVLKLHYLDHVEKDQGAQNVLWASWARAIYAFLTSRNVMTAGDCHDDVTLGVPRDFMRSRDTMMSGDVR